MTNELKDVTRIGPRLLDLPDATGKYPFTYTNIDRTSVARTFDRIRWQMARAGIEPVVVRVPPLVVDVVAKVPR